MHLKTLLVIAFRQFKSFCSKSESIFWILPKNPSKTFHSFKSTAVEIRISKIRYYLLSILVLSSDPKTNQHWQQSEEIWSRNVEPKWDLHTGLWPISSLSEAFSVKSIKVWLTLFVHEVDVISHVWSCWCWPWELRRQCPK